MFLTQAPRFGGSRFRLSTVVRVKGFCRSNINKDIIGVLDYIKFLFHRQALDLSPLDGKKKYCRLYLLSLLGMAKAKVTDHTQR